MKKIQSRVPYTAIISTVDIWCAAMKQAMGQLTTTAAPASTAWPANNRAIYVPIEIPDTMKFDRFWAFNGGTAGGNIDLGVYTQDFVLITSTGSTARSGTSVIQKINAPAAFALSPGLYYLGCAISVATDSIFQWTLANAVHTDGCSVYEESSALPLPATATPVTMTAGFGVPVIGMFTTGSAY